MRMLHNELEIERGYCRSLMIVAGTFFIANLVLFIGFTASASAQTMDSAASVMALARMRAAPDVASDLTFDSGNLFIFGAMGAGLLVMAGGLIAMTKNLVQDFTQPEKSRY